MTDKNELRRLVQGKIAALPEEYIAASNEGITRQIKQLPEFDRAQKILIYHSVGREPDTLSIVKALFDAGKTVAFPYCYRGGIMDAKVVSSLDELRPAVLGIPAPPDTAASLRPEELDLIIVPALTYDRDGFRLGYGGGYYDRYLTKTGAFTAGITRERLMRCVLPREPHDIAVKCLITENGAQYYSRAQK